MINENFDSGATLFNEKSRMTIANDNNVKFVTENNSTNGYSNATYDFDTDGSVAVKINFSYWIANNSCNYDVAFIIRDKDVAAGHGKQTMGLNGAFFSIGRTRQSSVNYFSVNRGKTINASNDNLGIWCDAEIYIDLLTKKIDYKISKTEGGAVIKEEKGISFKDANAVNVNQIDFFACVNNETDYLDNLVITKYTAESPSFNYSVNAKCDDKVLKTVAAGIVQQGLPYSVSGLPLAIMDNGICYKLDDSEVKNYKKTFTMGNADAVESVSYSVADDINYFFEAENILSKTYGNSDGDYSGGKTAGVYLNANLHMPSIASGVYTVTVNSSVRRANEDQFKVQVSTDNVNWKDAGIITLTNSKPGDYSVENIVLPSDGAIRLVEAKGQNMCHYIDYITLQKTGEAITLSEAENYTYSTYCSDYDLDFSSVEGVEVYKAAVSGDKVITEKIEDGKVPAGKGIIIKNVGHKASVVVPLTTGVPDLEGNALVGVTADMTNSDFVGKNAYILVSDTEFKAVDTEKEATLKKGKAYLQTTAAGAKFSSLFMDEATAIEGVAEQTKKAGAIYNIQGIRVKAPAAKGLYIINGKKYQF